MSDQLAVEIHTAVFVPRGNITDHDPPGFEMVVMVERGDPVYWDGPLPLWINNRLTDEQRACRARLRQLCEAPVPASPTESDRT